MPESVEPRPTENDIRADDLRDDLERGLRFTHVMLAVVQEQGNEAVAYAQALLEMLVMKGILGQEEVGEALERARQVVADALMPRVRLADMGDKYADGQSAPVDCASLITYCRGRCCTLTFFLTRQDLDEGVARWDYGNPYWIRRGADGYCVHSDPEGRACTIYQSRPHACRRFDCRNDQRIWADFNRRIPAPEEPPTGVASIALAEMSLRAYGEAGEPGADEV